MNYNTEVQFSYVLIKDKKKTYRGDNFLYLIICSTEREFSYNLYLFRFYIDFSK